MSNIKTDKHCADGNTFSMLLASKTYPNKLDRDGDTAVHIAIRENNMTILKNLLQHHVSSIKTCSFLY